MNLLDLITLLSFVGLTVDILLQAHKVRQVKSSEDISLLGLSVRFFAIFIILYKLIMIGDFALIVGQAMLAVVFTSYLVLVVAYLPGKKKKRRR